MRSLILAFLLSFGAAVHSADVALKFDPVSEATGYRIEMSTDLGVTWAGSQDTSNQTTYTYTNVPEDALVLFRAVAYNDVTEAIRTYSGAWYDHRQKLPNPSGLGI